MLIEKMRVKVMIFRGWGVWGKNVCWHHLSRLAARSPPGLGLQWHIIVVIVRISGDREVEE